MTRMIPLDGANKIEVVGNLTGKRVYHKNKRGVINVDSAADRRDLIAEGLAVPATAAGPSTQLPGYTCPCGRHNYFKTCGKCGSSEGVRDDG